MLSSLQVFSFLKLSVLAKSQKCGVFVHLFSWPPTFRSMCHSWLDYGLMFDLDIYLIIILGDCLSNTIRSTGVWLNHSVKTIECALILEISQSTTNHLPIYPWSSVCPFLQGISYARRCLIASGSRNCRRPRCRRRSLSVVAPASYEVSWPPSTHYRRRSVRTSSEIRWCGCCRLRWTHPMSERKMLQTVYKHVYIEEHSELGAMFNNNWVEALNDFFCHRPQFHHRHDITNNNTTTNNNANNNNKLIILILLIIIIAIMITLMMVVMVMMTMITIIILIY